MMNQSKIRVFQFLDVAKTTTNFINELGNQLLVLEEFLKALQIKVYFSKLPPKKHEMFAKNRRHDNNIISFKTHFV